MVRRAWEYASRGTGTWKPFSYYTVSAHSPVVSITLNFVSSNNTWEILVLEFWQLEGTGKQMSPQETLVLLGLMLACLFMCFILILMCLKMSHPTPRNSLILEQLIYISYGNKNLIHRHRSWCFCDLTVGRNWSPRRKPSSISLIKLDHLLTYNTDNI